MDEDPRLDPFLSGPLSRLAIEHRAWVLANAVTDAPDGRALNLNVLYGPDGKVEGTYAKRHLVPYGERVPFRSFLEGKIGELNRIPRDFAPGKKPGLFDIAGFKVATVICFESAFGYQIRPLVRDGAEVIVVSTNNRSYRRSANSAQHVAIGQIRAAETGRPVVQAAISGISALIDASGREHAHTELFERTVLQGSVEATRGTTLYVRFGDWVVLGVAARPRRLRRRPRREPAARLRRLRGPSRGRAAGPGTGRRRCMNHDETSPERPSAEHGTTGHGTTGPGRRRTSGTRCTCSCTRHSARGCRRSTRRRRSSKRSSRAARPKSTGATSRCRTRRATRGAWASSR